MKAGAQMTAAGIMFALTQARTKLEAELLNRAIASGRWRHRGKGRGGIVHRFGKSGSVLPDRGADGKAAARRRRQTAAAWGNPFKQIAREKGWQP